MSNQKNEYSIWGVGPTLNILALVLLVVTFILRIWFTFPFDLNIVLRIFFIFIFIFLLWFLFRYSLASLPMVNRNRQLSTNGAFAYVRHPLYASVLYTIPPILILLMQDFIFVLSLIVYFIGLSILVRKEEQALIEIFGEDYKKYQRTVPALLFYKGAAGKKLDFSNQVLMVDDILSENVRSVNISLSFGLTILSKSLFK